MKKIVATIVIIILLAVLLLFLFYNFLSGISPDELGTIYQKSDLILTLVNILMTSLLGYLVYRVNYRLTEITVKEHDSKIKESSYQIYYCLNYNIESILNWNGAPTQKPSLSFKMKGDYINYIANLSKKLPDELIHELYNIFFDLEKVAKDINNNNNVKILFDRIFKQGPAITIDNYRNHFNSKFSLIYNEIFELINVSN